MYEELKASAETVSFFLDVWKTSNKKYILVICHLSTEDFEDRQLVIHFGHCVYGNPQLSISTGILVIPLHLPSALGMSPVGLYVTISSGISQGIKLFKPTVISRVRSHMGHTGEDMAKEIQDELQNFDLGQKLVAICNDNASNNPTLCHSLHKLLKQ
ncbi:hypothetical protein TSTA_061190 [Talaromyces stipitatus ATCC 10500]|uniref:DUF659 domain-containing protein n=1 Tax=Talaromyces stipitatus (strain ATCC 10500 / CBS 375.48 / QM 6759 / NRRL 1006) TaxID=441959 RepID=B8LV07_TALSN|nr:uncharacterized protein TSTA_061190 [Talaromyces stipitatus ATCC 10500]EED22628.1 hypothetical protein TSTA_061190 [Talaromyces stipitatus ATCC 10500]